MTKPSKITIPEFAGVRMSLFLVKKTGHSLDTDIHCITVIFYTGHRTRHCLQNTNVPLFFTFSGHLFKPSARNRSDYTEST